MKRTRENREHESRKATDKHQVEHDVHLIGHYHHKELNHGYVYQLLSVWRSAIKMRM